MELVISLNVEKFVESWNASAMFFGEKSITREEVCAALHVATDALYGSKSTQYAWMHANEVEKFASSFENVFLSELALQDSTTLKLF